MTRRQIFCRIGALSFHPAAQAQQSTPGARSLNDFFNAFTAEWVRGNPAIATLTRYFKGEEQDQLDRQLIPLAYRNPIWGQQRVVLAKRGLMELGAFKIRGHSLTIFIVLA